MTSFTYQAKNKQTGELLEKITFDKKEAFEQEVKEKAVKSS